MRDIRDPESPYRGQYTEFDYWCYANAADMNNFDYEKAYSGESEAQVFSALVDDAGFLVPQLAETQKQYASYFVTTDEEGGCDKAFTVYGVLPPELQGQLGGAQARAMYAHLPAVPDWLAAAPPKYCVLLDDGEVVAAGELGAGAGDFKSDRWMMTEEDQLTWHRYAADGKLVSDGQPGEDWQALYMPNYDELKGRETDDGGVALFCEGRYVVLYKFDESGAEGEWAGEIYDYRGNLLDISIEELDWRAGSLMTLSGGMLQLVYVYQQQAKPAGAGDEAASGRGAGAAVGG